MVAKAWLALPADPHYRNACWGLGRTWVAAPQLVSWPTQSANRATPVLPRLTGKTPGQLCGFEKGLALGPSTHLVIPVPGGYS